MKNIVILTRRYYPNMSPISAVIDKYIQRLKKDYNIHIICIAGSSGLEKPSDTSINVYYIKNKWLMLRLWSEEKYISQRNKLYYYIMQSCRARSAFLNLFKDNYAYQWECDAYYSVITRLSSEVPIHAIISVSGDTLFTHMAAKKFKEKHSGVKWITYFTDPYTFQNQMFYPTLFDKKKNKNVRFKAEKSVYDNADYNISTVELYKSIIEDFAQAVDKTICFDYVLERVCTEFIPNTPKEKSVRLMYAGAFYRNIRNPKPMLEIMKEVQGVKFDLYVTVKECDDILQKYKSNAISICDGVSVEEYKRKISGEYDILVNVGNDCQYQAPSKMLEYISTGRPILNFYYRKDSQYQLIEKYPLGLNVDIHDMNSVDVVNSFCHNMKGKFLKFEEIEVIFPNNCISKQTQMLRDLIEA